MLIRLYVAVLSMTMSVFIVVLAKEDEGPVTLTCNSTPGTAIKWKFDGEPLEDTAFGTRTTQNGQHLNLSEVDFSMLGEYSCWSEGHELSSVYLLLKHEEPGETFLLIFLSFHHSVHVTCLQIVLLVL